MSAPEVGDRVRVIAGPWIGWDAKVLDVLEDGWVWVNLTAPCRAYILNPLTFARCLRVAEVEVVPMARTQPPSGDDEGSGAPVEPRDAHGAQKGGKR